MLLLEDKKENKNLKRKEVIRKLDDLGIRIFFVRKFVGEFSHFQPLDFVPRYREESICILYEVRVKSDATN